MSKNEITIGRKKGKMCHCPNCKTPYARANSDMGQKEVCGVCTQEVVLVEGKPKKK